MAQLFDVKDVDKRLYTEELADFLPGEIIDVHTHVWRDTDTSHNPKALERVVSWPMRVALDNPLEDLVETYRLMFPGKRVIPLMFSLASEGDDMDVLNGYISRCAAQMKFPALIFAHPTWTGAELDTRMRAGGFLGAKVYLNLSPSYIPRKEIRVFDFLPPHQLDVLNRGGLVVMLHIPRDLRLRDPVNLAQMLEIERNWPKVKLLIAHVGRAYCNEDVGNAFEVLRVTKNMVFDFTANTNAWVFEQALSTFGAERCVFGSDLPITRMRMRRICENGIYVNLVPRGLYGDVSGDKNMREVDPPEADAFSFFMYEEILAIKSACRKAGVGKSGVEAVFYRNARRILGI